MMLVGGQRDRADLSRGAGSSLQRRRGGAHVARGTYPGAHKAAKVGGRVGGNNGGITP